MGLPDFRKVPIWLLLHFGTGSKGLPIRAKGVGELLRNKHVDLKRKGKRKPPMGGTGR